MEIVLDLVLAVGLSLLFSFFLAKILSLSSSPSTNGEYDLASASKHCNDFVQEMINCKRGSEGEKRDSFVAKLVKAIASSKREKGDTFVAKIVGEDELGRSKVEKLLIDSSCGSCVKVEENEVSKEVEMGRAVEETSSEFTGSRGCGEGERFSKVEKDLTSHQVCVAKSEEIEVPESKRDIEIDEVNLSPEDNGESSVCYPAGIFVDKSTVFESEKTAKFKAESTETQACLTRSEEMEVVSKGNCDDDVDVDVDEANTNQEHGGKLSIFSCNEIVAYEGGILGIDNFEKIGSESITAEVGMARSEAIEVLQSECDNGSVDGKANEADDVEEDVLFDEDDDWEGIERTELERLFGAAVAFAGNKRNADVISSIGGDVKMLLYGLHKIATVGPCHESQPMALKVSARANWNAWKQLGSMTPEIAMEQYVTILSRSISANMHDDISGDIKKISAAAEACSKLASDLKAYQATQICGVDKRNIEEQMACPGGF